MKKYYVYILVDKAAGLRYKGMTTDLRNRLSEHNSGKTKSTRKGKHWEVEYYEEYSNIQEAREREKYLKTAAGRRWIKDKLGPIVQRIE